MPCIPARRPAAAGGLAPNTNTQVVLLLLLLLLLGVVQVLRRDVLALRDGVQVLLC